MRAGCSLADATRMMKGCARHALASQTCCLGHLSHPRQPKLSWWLGPPAGNIIGGSGKFLCHFRRPVACNMIIHPSIYPSTCIGQAALHMQGLKAAVTIVHTFTTPGIVIYVATTRNTERKSKIVPKRVGPPPEVTQNMSRFTTIGSPSKCTWSSSKTQGS